MIVIDRHTDNRVERLCFHRGRTPVETFFTREFLDHDGIKRRDPRASQDDRFRRGIHGEKKLGFPLVIIRPEWFEKACAIDSERIDYDIQDRDQDYRDGSIKDA
jgi:hypothetical protein